jgi:hypothetical protein
MEPGRPLVQVNWSTGIPMSEQVMEDLGQACPKMSARPVRVGRHRPFLNHPTGASLLSTVNFANLSSLLMSKAQLPRGLELCRSYAKYAQDILREANGKGKSSNFPANMTLGGASELHKLVERYLEAWRNPGIVHTCPKILVSG